MDGVTGAVSEVYSDLLNILCVEQEQCGDGFTLPFKTRDGIRLPHR